MFSRVTNYIKETRHEMRKVNWPKRRQVVRSTLAVIVISLAVAFYLGAFDYLFRFLLQTLVY